MVDGAGMMGRNRGWKGLIGGLGLAGMTIGCQQQPTPEQLETWRQETIAQNQQLVAYHQMGEQQSAWELQITGQVDRPLALNLSELLPLATTTLKTTDPHGPKNATTVYEFQGIAIAQLLNQAGITNPVTEVTFVAFDGYRATVQLKDLQQYPILLAMKRDGKPIPRTEGGPLYLVFPYSPYPALKSQYGDPYWVFYVTNIVVGTEPAKLKISGPTSAKTLSQADFQKLPQVTLQTPVGYSQDWPVGTVTLQGVRVKDAIAIAQIPLNNTDQVMIRGKAPTDQDPKNPRWLKAQTLKECDILLVTQWDRPSQLIPARMGGPLTLAYPPSCIKSSQNERWPTFVEELVIQPADRPDQP